MPKAKLESLVEDFNFYPRTMVSSTHVNAMVDAIKSGTELPAIHVETKSRRIIDGFHRMAAHRKVKAEEIEVEWITCADEQEFYALAVEANAGHGRPYTPFDKARIRARAEELGFSLDRIGQVLKMPLDSLFTQKQKVFGTTPDGSPLPLKRSFAWKAGEELTTRQMRANARSGGMNLSFYANQISEAIEAELVDWSSEGTQQALAQLYLLLAEHQERLADAA